MLEAADILLVNDNGVLGTSVDVVSDSPWSHAAIVVDPDGGMAIDARPFSKISTRAIKQFNKHALVLRHPSLNQNQKIQIIDYVKAQLNKEYDYVAIVDELLRYGFGISAKREASHERFICSTLITSAYLNAGIRLTDEPIASPEDLFLSDKITVVGRLGIDLI